MKVLVYPWFALFSMLLTACVFQVDAIEVAQGLIERCGKPPPESEWNPLQVWRRVSDQPPTYIPSGYDMGAPRTEKEGRWYVDRRDGKRLFAPYRKASRLEPEVLEAEAKKVTAWSRRQYTSVQPGIFISP